MSKFCSGGLALGCLFLSAVSMQAGVITANFGSGSGVTGFVLALDFHAGIIRHRCALWVP